jgi:TPP-dependent pyruvate/acetoin dehydrogenase alpha subunit
MPVRARAKSPDFDSSRFQGLSRDQLIRMYRTMYLSRRLDDREIQLKMVI